MNRIIYSFLFYLSTPLLILRLAWRSLRSPAYLSRWGERFAFYSGNTPRLSHSIVFHAVSVGEVHAAVPLVNLLMETRPGISIVVTTSTPTGSARVISMLGGKVAHVYLPYDYPGAVQRFLDRFNPGLLVIMETELWPNLIHYCRRRHVKMILANARLSEKSLNNYLKIAGLTRTMLHRLTLVSAQSKHDGDRFVELGLPADKLEITGSMKFDQTIDSQQVEAAKEDKRMLGDRPVLIAASTRVAGGVVEDEKVLSAFREMLSTRNDLLLILVPRHPERFDAVYELAARMGLKVARRSREGGAGESDQVLLGDTMGEMQYYFALADVAYVGGSLVPTGCQNIIEPAALGLPVITGPSLFNFQSVSDRLIAAGGMKVVANQHDLALAVTDLLENEEKRAAMGSAAREAVIENQGATGRNLVLIERLLPGTR